MANSGSDYILVSKGITIDPKRVKNSLLTLRAKVGGQIAEEVRKNLSAFLRLLRKEQSSRLKQLQDAGLGSNLWGNNTNNPFAGAQARKHREKGKNGKWHVNVIHGSQDTKRGIVGSLFNMLDVGSKGRSGRQLFAVWEPYSRLIYKSLTIGQKVKLKTHRLKKSGELVADFASVEETEGYAGYDFYDKAVELAKKKLIGREVKSDDGLTVYKITARDFKANKFFEKVKDTRRYYSEGEDGSEVDY